MLRLLVFAVLVWGAYHLIKKMARAYFASFRPPEERNGSDSDAELIRDPQCGAYFMKQKGVKGIVEGKAIYFCSQECCDRYHEGRSAK